jgi:hypothetical protein
MRHTRLRRNATALFWSAALGLTLLAPAPEAEAGPNPRDIMGKVALTRKLDGSEAVVKMSILNAKGQKREREITMATKLYDGGKTEKRIYRFLSPPDVKGTGVLVFDYESKADDVWVFLPALRKTRRIISSQRSKSFMGSEFSYGDLNIPALDDFTYQLVKQEAFGGEPCWVIDVVPKNKGVADSEGYSKKTYWVSQGKYVVRRGLYYDLGGQLLKELRMDNIKLLDPNKQRYRALRLEMTNKKNGRRSVFESKKVTFAPQTKDEYFTTRYLERT